MWLTVRGGVYPSPIIPSSSSFEPWWRFYVCVRVEKAATRAGCQRLAHVVNIRNQTGANRTQVRLAIAFICTKKPRWHVIISHWCLGTVFDNRPSVWRDGCGWRSLNISIHSGGVRINSFNNWAPQVETGRQMLCLQVFAHSVSCPRVWGSLLDCVCSEPAMSHAVLSCLQEESVEEAVFVTSVSCYSHGAFVCRYPRVNYDGACDSSISAHLSVTSSR